MQLEDSIAAEIVPASDWSDAGYRLRFEQTYLQLRNIARRQLRGMHRGTLNTTVLVHEAFLKLDGIEPNIGHRHQFLSLAAKAMRCVLVDHVRASTASKRGGGLVQVTFPTNLQAEGGDAIDLLAIERGLRLLEAWDPRLAMVVERRFYGGMGMEDIAESLGVDPRTVLRDWHKARAFLLAQLGDAPQ